MSELIRLPEVTVEILPFGEQAILLRRTDDRADPLVLPRLGARLMASESAGFADVVATEVELMVVGTEGVPLEQLKRQATTEIKRQSSATARESWDRPRKFRLPVCFETGVDWRGVLKETGITREEYVERVLRARLVLTMYGFVPGFLYMSGLPEALRCARKGVPDQRAEAGSVAVGGPYLGIYGLETPAGWNVIGHTPVRPVEIRELPPTPFRVGDEFHVVEISSESLWNLRVNPPRLEELLIHA
jgi:KipI family sensor histidine kinase inhibitor